MGFWWTVSTAKVYTWQELEGLYPSVEPEFTMDEQLLVMKIMRDTIEVLETTEELKGVTVKGVHYKYKVEKK